MNLIMVGALGLDISFCAHINPDRVILYNKILLHVNLTILVEQKGKQKASTELQNMAIDCRRCYG